jgi:hypothetical protein
MANMLTLTNDAVWAIGAADGVTLIEVVPYFGKFVVAIVRNGTDRTCDSKRGMTLERAKARATWLAGRVSK